MSTTEPQTAAPRFRHRWYQFTLREMLLASLAFCLLCALFAAERHFRAVLDAERHSARTPLIALFDADDTVTAACLRLGLKRGQPTNLGSALCGSDDRKAVAFWCVHFYSESRDGNSPQPPMSRCGEVLAETKKEIEGLLRHHGCEIDGNGTFGRDLSQNNYCGFDLDYHKGGTNGDVRVFATACPKNEWEIFFVIHEWVKYRPMAP